MKILLSGFEPFGEWKTNPSEQLMAALSGRFDTIVLPVTLQHSFELLNQKIKEVNPDVVLCTGLAADRLEIEIERIAINCLDFSLADNNGVIKRNLKISDDGPDGIFSTLPIVELSEHFKISNSAGTYICNYLMYRLLQTYSRYGIQAGFIHLPGKKNFSEIENDFEHILRFFS